ncbi:MAG: hypothetical protein IJT13_03315 [Bacteroidaceae bacterium]|nr:hypothetical protein [Bacteroidaceae bacterium]
MEKARMNYVPPRVELYRTEASQILAGTTEMHQGSAGSGTDDGVVTGSKTVILGQEFSFTDVWEE